MLLEPNMRIAPVISLSQAHHDQLQVLAGGRRVQVRIAERARLVLLAAEGRQDIEIAALLGITRQKAARWRARFIRLGIPGIEKDAPRSGTKNRISPTVVREVVRKTTLERPDNATHWSTPSLSRVMKISTSSVGRIWRAHGLKPHLVKTYKVSNDRNFTEKLEDIVGLYLSPPEHALVFSCDEKSQIQALDRTQPGLPIKKGRCGTMTHDYKRNGTTTQYPGWDGDWHLHETASAPGMAEVPALDRRANVSREGTASDRRQLCDPQTSGGATMAEASSPISHALHSHQRVMAQHG